MTEKAIQINISRRNEDIPELIDEFLEQTIFNNNANSANYLRFNQINA